ncbi:hypothetical protein V5O48_012052 [Marasmius crinis-equi]|uniref:Cytochrome P450 n=1 Tax=Marasmius crinis-equi TaxID=585013 RepID=A0ABR3F4B7_9AGAR
MSTFTLSVLKDFGLFHMEQERNQTDRSPVQLPSTKSYSLIWSGFVPVVVTAAIFYFLWRRIQAKPPYPPGPTPKFLIGNLLDMPKSKPWKTYREWSKKAGSAYSMVINTRQVLRANLVSQGDLIHFEINSQHTVVINTKGLSDRMLNSRAGVYSDRPYVAMVDMLGWLPFNTSFLRYTDTWRKHRRLYQQAFRSRSAQEYLPLQASKNSEFISKLREDPDNFMAHIRSLTAAVILDLIYGYEVTPTNNYLAELVEEITKFAETEFESPATAIVNLFPALRHLPLSLPIFRFQRAAAKSQMLIEKLLDVPYDYVRKNMRTGEGRPSLMARFLEENDEEGGDKVQESVIKGVCATGYGAGVDTTAAVIETFFLAIAMHPDVQAKARNELELVVGKGRVPGYEERPNLPYIEAIIREVFRWVPPVPLSVPRAAFVDDVFDDYYIPKGAMVLSNIWAMSRDEAVYPNPESFVPERFLNEDGTCNSDDDSTFIFGAGRRICPGRHFATTTLWMVIVSVLTEFDIGKPKTIDGKEMLKLADAKYTEGMISHPTPFLCSITPRSGD